MTEPPKKKRYKLRIPDPNKPRKIRLRQKDVDLLALNAAGYTHKEAGIMVGYPPNSAAQSAGAAIANIKKKLSKNQLLQEYLDNCGATLQKVAQVVTDGMNATTPLVLRGGDYVKEDGKLRRINTAEIIHTPDNRCRLEAAKLTATIHGAMPEKVVINESRSFEAKIAIMAEIKQNPEHGFAVIKALLEQKSERGGE